MNKLFLFLALTLIGIQAPAQTKHLVKMTEARQAFLKRNYWGALKIYREILASDSSNATVNYRVGETQYALKHYDIAKRYLTKAYTLDPKVDPDALLMLGRVHHRLAELDEAKEHYRQFREISVEARSRAYDVSLLIEQCDYAKEMMAKPVDVQIDNLNKEINSRFDDYAPSLTADGSMMVFTSRRPSMSNAVDEAGDHKYFEDIYFSEWNAKDGRWEAAELFSETVNSPTHDAVLSISGKGDRLFVYKNDTDHAGDIYESKLTGNWSIPEKLPRPINTSYFESSISLTADGSTMYFVSERPSGMGRGDIYVSHKITETDWSKPVNLGEIINTVLDEKFVFIHPNGNTLFFASNGHLSMGSYDIFRSELKDGEWTTPVNLGYPINTVNEESTFSMTADNQKLLISAEYAGGFGERDIYEVDLSQADILHSLNIDSELLQRKNHITVYGSISIENGKKPGAFKDVIVYDAKGEMEIYRTRSDRRGQYELSLPRDVNYLLRVQLAPGRFKKKKVSLKGLFPEDTEYRVDMDY